MRSGLTASRARRSASVGAFTLLLVAVCAVPVLGNPDESVPTDPPVESGPGLLPSEAPAATGLSEAAVSAELAEGYAQYREELVQREAELEDPALVAERVRSRDAYEDLGPAEAEGLIRSLFGDVLEKLNKDPARFLSDAKLEQVAEVDAATVTSEGDSQLFEAGLPVRAEEEDGDLSKVDLTLERTAEGWESANPLVDVVVGERAEEGIEVGDEEVVVTQVGSEDSTGRPLGDKNLLFPEVEDGRDTDLMVSPTATGVELFNLLRSANSPEALRFRIETPAGSELRSVQGGGAEVVDADGEASMLIPPPWGRDAQGTSVPVTMHVEGDTLVLGVEHRDEDFAYPILVDPLYQDWGWWYEGKHAPGLSAWSWNQTAGNWWVNHGYTESQWPGYQGLAIASAPGNLPGGHWGQWSYSAPNAGSYLADATINPFLRSNRTCYAPNPYPQPYDYVGMWNETSYNRLLFNEANKYGWANLESWGRALVIGMGTSSGINIPCWRDLLVGGVGIWLDDWQYPYLDYVGPTPEGWLKKDGVWRTFDVSASDAGLGVRTVRMFGVATEKWHWSKGSCAGTYEERCPNSNSGQISFKTEGFPYEGRYNSEGKERKFTVQVEDPTTKTWGLERPLWLDGTPAVVSLSGQLATITEQKGSSEKGQGEGSDQLSLPTYNLQISADDGADRSGVKEIKVFLDKDPSKDPNAVPSEVKSVSCPTAGCEQTLTMDYTLRLPGLDPGKHSLWVVAVDKVGNESDPQRNIEFEYMPATGMKEEFVLQHFRLPDGHDYSGEAEYHGPEIAVNVMNGNVVFHERDVDVETDRANVELERVYNSQQPIQEDTQWGRGWSIAQAPELEPESGPSPPQKATAVETGKVTSSVPIPQSQSQATFSSRLHATITKTSAGYEVEPATESEVSVFSASGRIEEVVQGDNAPAYLEPEEGESIPPTPSTYQSAFGSFGSGNGQLKHPAGIAVDSAGNLWIVDQDNYRVQKFNAAGEYQGSFGSQGSGDGQFGRPTDIAIDAVGNLWITDAGNSRIQKFTSQGVFIAKYGSLGTGNGQFKNAETIAIDPKGNIWIGDTYNARLQKFSSSFVFIAKYGSYGSGEGQLKEPTGIDIGPGGSVWVADWGNNRVSVFGENGEFIRQFGSAGSGDGQFSRPDVIEVGGKGYVWVGDEGNGRIQQFNQNGEYIAQFGAKGTGTGQFTFTWPMGIASDSKGNLWISDTANNRVQQWRSLSSVVGAGEGPAPYFDAPAVDYEYVEGKLAEMQIEDEATEGADPSVEMTLSSGLVSSVDSSEEGDTTYGYESGKLKKVGGQDGETKFGYVFGKSLINSVTLPNGTVATITYDGTSRATSVKVDPAGPEGPQTTNFSYSAEPRRTIVWGGGNPEITYDIGEDGSVLKWAYAETPPTIASISGSLWSKRGQEIENSDHTLFVTGSSPHQVASIKVVANGNSVVAEKVCEDPSEPPSHVCDQPEPLTWVPHASEHAPGRMDLEVIVTDFLGHQAAERFFVIVPQQPPPDPEAVERPTFRSIKLFREENGLDRNKSLTEFQLTEMLLELLYDWERRDETAIKAVENFGVPMHASELAEMEYRRQYLAQAAEAIPAWAEEHAPTTYGGYYIDNRQGGVIYVGFTQNQAALVEALKQSGVLMAPSQVKEMPTPPTRAIVDVEALEESVAAFINGNPTASGATAGIAVKEETGRIEVTATNPTLVEGLLDTHFGSGAPIDVVLLQYPSMPLSGEGHSRFHASGPVHAGDWLRTQGQCESGRSCYKACTANFGGRDQVDVVGGEPVFNYYKLTAGHCFGLLTRVKRQPSKAPATNAQLASVGQIERSGWNHMNANGNFTDAEAIHVNRPLASSEIFYGNPQDLIQVNGMERARLHTEYCWSGVNGAARECGMAYERKRDVLDGHRLVGMWVLGASVSGDSGGPVWNPITKKAVGVLTLHNRTSKKPCTYLDAANTKRWCPRTFFTPLMPFYNKSYPDGAMAALGVELVRGR